MATVKKPKKVMKPQVTEVKDNFKMLDDRDHVRLRPRHVHS